MNAKGCSHIPRELFNWITFLAQNLPARSVRTFIELLLGAMLTPAGFGSEAYLMLEMRNHWTSYYKRFQKGKWSWLALVNQFARLLLSFRSEDVSQLVIDDTLTLRASKRHRPARYTTNTATNPTWRGLCGDSVSSAWRWW